MLQLAVTTHSTTFQRMQEPLSERGIDVVHLDVEGRSLALDATDSPWSADRFDIGYVYPSRLMEGGVLDALLPLPWVNDRDAVVRSRNKAGIIARANDADLRVPSSVLVSNPISDSHLVDVWASFDGPVVVKPNSTTRGVGVAKATDFDTFRGIVDYLELVHDFRATGDKTYLVQEFVADARDVRVMVIDGEYVGAVERKAPAADGDDRWKHNVHRGGRARGITPRPEVRTFAERVAAVVDVPIVGIDLLVTSEGPYLSETNARPTIDRVTKYEEPFWDRLAEAIERRAGCP